MLLTSFAAVRGSHPDEDGAEDGAGAIDLRLVEVGAKNRERGTRWIVSSSAHGGRCELGGHRDESGAMAAVWVLPLGE